MSQKIKVIITIVCVFLVLAGLSCFFTYNHFFGAPQSNAELEQFNIPLLVNSKGEKIVDNYDLPGALKNAGYIKNEWGFKYAFGNTKIQSGAYKLSKSMTAWQVTEALKNPYMKWVVIPEGLRKEQIAEILADELGWSEQDKIDWITKYTATESNYMEGVYFPDTYLIPVTETPSDVAKRFLNKFNDEFKSYSNKFYAANIKWSTALKIASIVQREAAGKSDMPMVAGVIWNRLLSGMRLQIDATVQYAKDDVTHYGKVSNGEQLLTYSSAGDWWGSLKSGDTSIDSAYNTYLNKGLPPHPICNPGIDAIDAVLNPAKTDCLYYLHDSNGQIHCSVTYEEHQKNIEQYLK